MRAMVLILVVMAAIGYLIHDKLAERDQLYGAANDFFWEYSQGSATRKERLDLFRPCFGQAYELSLIPGGDRVDLDVLVGCLNGENPVFDVRRIRDEKPPFRHR